MADLAGADAYFAKTLRSSTWQAFGDKREAAIEEAGSMIARLGFLRTPPSSSTENATYEQAFCLLEQQNADQEVTAAIAQGIKARSLVDASESYATAAERDKDPGWINGVFYCPKALSWISGYMGTPVRIGSYHMRDWW